MTASLGARVLDVDLVHPDSHEIGLLRAALVEHKVLFFPEADLDDEAHVALASRFGRVRPLPEAERDPRSIPTVEDHPEIFVVDGNRPTRANVWHTDVTFAADPPIVGVLSMQTAPARGGDTLWSDTEAALATLSSPVRQLLTTLRAEHGRPGRTPRAVHPVVRKHPITGRAALYVNRGWTTSIRDLSPIESSHLLGMLFEHMERPELTVRWSWSAGDVAAWDNRSTMHYVLDDFGDAERVAHLTWGYTS